MRDTHKISAEIKAAHDELTSLVSKANEEKRSLSECDEYKVLKEKYDVLNVEYKNTKLAEDELRSMPATSVPSNSTGEKRELGLFVKKSENRYLGLGDTAGSAELARSTTYSNEIIEAVNKQVIMRQKANVTSVSGWSYKDTVGVGSVAAGFVGEAENYKDNSNLGIKQREYKLHKLMAYPKTTEETIDQSDIVNLEQWLLEKIAEGFSEVEDYAFWYGDGVGKPKGLLTYPIYWSGEWDKITPENATDVIQGISSSGGDATNIKSYINTDRVLWRALMSQQTKLKAKYQPNAEWYMTSVCWENVRIVSDANDRPLIGNLESGDGFTLLGKPVNIIDSFLPKDQMLIVYGDLNQAYQIVDSSNPIKINRDEVTEPEYVKFPTRTYVGSGLRNGEAIKLVSIRNFVAEVPPEPDQPTDQEEAA
ncbi:phage major capsid protein [Photobacterium rosenbergii]|uniref:Phage major capsid protein n=1 Tax=Photobacterium rosenbergii TaxID=294936 RepID=A0A2T3MYS8_9GAMM|nr:phage major capsid protein [Photobacterium rosenbergii]PSW05044.1 phage major capsid protein [Photobacterium rosenbergii]